MHPAGLFVAQLPSKACTSTTILTSAEACTSAKLSLDPTAGVVLLEDFAKIPKGCSRTKGKWYFNKHTTGTLDGASSPVCAGERDILFHKRVNKTTQHCLFISMG